MKLRILFGLWFSLFCTIVVIYFGVSRFIFTPITAEMVQERTYIVSDIADKISISTTPYESLHEMEYNFHVDAKIVSKANYQQRMEKNPPRTEPKVIDAHNRKIDVYPGRHSTMVTPIQIATENMFLVVRFPIDVDETNTKFRWGMLLTMSIIAIASIFLSKWVLTPLHKASLAMEEISKGNLSHRVQDDIGLAKDAFNRMAETVEKLLTEQKQLLAAISHELRTPLARLRIQTELLQQNEGTNAIGVSIEDDVRELDDLVEVLLLSSKLENNALHIQKEPCNIQECVLDVLAQVDLGDRYTKLDIDKELVVHVDKMLFQRVFSNILTNIVRYVPEDATVTIGAYKENNLMVIFIADTGLGVSPEFLERMFLPFTREDSSRSKNTGGIGLGLMFVHNMVVAHGGSVRAIPNKPQGLIIEIKLPN